jgi:NADH-quinone oxidoreductase subunit N
MNTLLLALLTPPNIDLRAIMPEMIVAVTGIIVMLYDVFFPKQRYVTGLLGIAGLCVSGVMLFSLWGDASGFTSTAWNGMVAYDNLRMGFSFVFLIVSALTILVSSVWVELEDVPIGEYHALLMFATFGMMLMAAGNDLVILFLGLETLSISTYVMAGLRKTDPKSNEAAMKYFILGSLASAFLLYGMALVYGAAGTTNITEIAQKVADPNFPGLFMVGAAMMIVGFGFKVAAVPFHVWTPDVYEGAPTPITSFMAAGPKAAGFAAFVRVFVIGFPLIPHLPNSTYLHESWMTVLAVLAILSMTVGNIAAIVQNNVKRMLAFSSISHAGYAMVGFIGAGAAATIAARDEAIAAVALYMLAYSITNIGAFAIIAVVGRKNDRRTDFEDFNGIGFRSPELAFPLSLFVLSLLGLPLTAGFLGKVLVFRPALEAGNTLLTIVVVVAVINTAISAYFYLRFIVVMFFRERTAEWTKPHMPPAMAAAILITVIGVFYIGIFGNNVIKKFSEAIPTIEANVR